MDQLKFAEGSLEESELFKRQNHKMVKHTQTICRQIADNLFKCV